MHAYTVLTSKVEKFILLYPKTIQMKSKKIIREQSCMSMTRAIEKHPVYVLTHAVYSTLMSNIMRNVVQSFTSGFTWPRCRRVVLVIVGFFDVTNDKINSIYINYSWLLISWNASQNINWNSVICTLILENEINANDSFDCFKSEYSSYFKVWKLKLNFHDETRTMFKDKLFNVVN